MVFLNVANFRPFLCAGFGPFLIAESFFFPLDGHCTRHFASDITQDALGTTVFSMNTRTLPTNPQLLLSSSLWDCFLKLCKYLKFFSSRDSGLH